MAEKSFEIPESMRDVAEQGVTQAKSVYDQLMEASRKVQEMMEQSSGAMFSSAKEIHQQALKYAEQNMQAGFTLADKLLKAKDIKEALEIQSAFARDQMTAYSSQAQELSKLMSEAAKKSQAG